MLPGDAAVENSTSEDGSMTRFDGKVAIVTGATAGIGEAIAGEVFARGASLVLAARDGAKAETCARVLDPTGQRALGVRVDVRDHVSVAAMVEATVARFGGLHLAVNNAGI